MVKDSKWSYYLLFVSFGSLCEPLYTAYFHAKHYAKSNSALQFIFLGCAFDMSASPHNTSCQGCHGLYCGWEPALKFFLVCKLSPQSTWTRKHSHFVLASSLRHDHDSAKPTNMGRQTVHPYSNFPKHIMQNIRDIHKKGFQMKKNSAVNRVPIGVSPWPDCIRGRSFFINQPWAKFNAAQSCHWVADG